LRILKGAVAGIGAAGGLGFTHHDPLEDTESSRRSANTCRSTAVSPITIRLRILKGREAQHAPTRDGFHPSRSA